MNEEAVKKLIYDTELYIETLYDNLSKTSDAIARAKEKLREYLLTLENIKNERNGNS